MMENLSNFLASPSFKFSLPLLLVALLSLSACGRPQYVTDEEKKDLDSYTMSLRFDRKDLNRLYIDIAPAMFESAVVRQWDQANPRPVVAIFPMRNETSEHIGPQLDALLSKMETDFVNQTNASVVSLENQPDLIAEIKSQQSDAYDPARVAQYGRQLGAQFIVTGKVYDSAERVGDERRVQYFMFVQIINVSTGEIRFQKEAAISKGLVN